VTPQLIENTETLAFPFQRADALVCLTGGRVHRAVVVEEPRIIVLESDEAADPSALDDALELLVKWAVRACIHDDAASAEAAIPQGVAAYGPED
jgi:hypothetical protein